MGYEVERLHGKPIVEGETIRALGSGTDKEEALSVARLHG